MTAASRANKIKNSDHIPNSAWPGAFGVYSYSKKVVLFNVQTYLPLILFSYIVDIAASYSSRTLIKVLLYLVFYLLTVTDLVVLINSLRGRKISISEALDKGTRIAVPLVGLYILVGLAIVISFLLLIIPGLIVLPRLVFAPYYMIDQGQGITESIKSSWRDSEGYGVITWGVIAVQILFGVLSLIIIGIYFSIVYSAALMILYGYIGSRPKAAKEIK